MNKNNINAQADNTTPNTDMSRILPVGKLIDLSEIVADFGRLTGHWTVYAARESYLPDPKTIELPAGVISELEPRSDLCFEENDSFSELSRYEMGGETFWHLVFSEEDPSDPNVLSGLVDQAEALAWLKQYGYSVAA